MNTLSPSDITSILADNQRSMNALMESLPTEQSCIEMMLNCRTRLTTFGWQDASYAPKDGTVFDAITAGFTGPSTCMYMGEYPSGGFFIASDNDWWPVTPTFFKLKKDHGQKTMSPDCQTCQLYDSHEGCTSENKCTNGDKYQPAPLVVLWKT